MTRSRQTLAHPTAWLVGVGLHSGVMGRVRVLPAESGAGRLFFSSGQEVPALVQNVSDTARCTTLSANGVSVQTVEHILSSLAGLGIDDAFIEQDGPEVPIGDGGAAPFVELLRAAGIVESGPAVEPLIVTQPVCVQGPNGETIVAVPADQFEASVVLHYPRHAYIGTQAALFAAASDDYAEQIAPARTFGFAAELEALKARGLAGGASLENALGLGETDYINPPRFANELARHKVLDLVGDLALLGRPVQGKVLAVRPGHALNVALAQALLALLT